MDWWASMNSCTGGAAASDMNQMEASIFDPWINCEDLDLGSILSQAGCNGNQQSAQLAHHSSQPHSHLAHSHSAHQAQQQLLLSSGGSSNQQLVAATGADFAESQIILGAQHSHQLTGSAGLMLATQGSPASSVASNSSADIHLSAHFSANQQQVNRSCAEATTIITTATSSASTTTTQTPASGSVSVSLSLAAASSPSSAPDSKQNIFNIISNAAAISSHQHHQLSYLQQQQQQQNIQSTTQRETSNGQSCSSSTGSSSSLASSLESSPINGNQASNNNNNNYLANSPSSSSPILLHHHHLHHHHHHLPSTSSISNNQTASTLLMIDQNEQQQQQQHLILNSHLNSRQQHHLHNKQIVLQQHPLVEPHQDGAGYLTCNQQQLSLANNTCRNEEKREPHDEAKREQVGSLRAAVSSNCITLNHLSAPNHDLHHQGLLNQQTINRTSSVNDDNNNNHIQNDSNNHTVIDSSSYSEHSVSCKSNDQLASLLQLSHHQQQQQLEAATTCDTTTTIDISRTIKTNYDEQSSNDNINNNNNNNNSNSNVDIRESNLFSGQTDHLIAVYPHSQSNISCLTTQTSSPASPPNTLLAAPITAHHHHHHHTTEMQMEVNLEALGSSSGGQQYRSQQQQVSTAKIKGFSNKSSSNTITNQPSSVQKVRRCRHITDYVLAEEEKILLIKEGYTDFPMTCQARPLSKTEERILRKIRRKIRNKKSAQCSRQRKKEYVEDLERKYAAVIRENEELKQVIDRIKQLQQHQTPFNGASLNLDWKDLFVGSKLSQANHNSSQAHTIYN